MFRDILAREPGLSTSTRVEYLRQLATVSKQAFKIPRKTMPPQ